MGKPTVRQQELAKKRRFWKDHIETWKSGGLKQSEYCRRHQLKLHCFVYWKKKFRPVAEPGVSFVQVYPPQIFKSPTSYRLSPLRLLVGKYKIEVESGFDPATLKQLVVALGQL